MRALKAFYSEVIEGGVVVNCEKHTIFPEHPICYKYFIKNWHIVPLSSSIMFLYGHFHFSRGRPFKLIYYVLIRTLSLHSLPDIGSYKLIKGHPVDAGHTWIYWDLTPLCFLWSAVREESRPEMVCMFFLKLRRALKQHALSQGAQQRRALLTDGTTIHALLTEIQRTQQHALFTEVQIARLGVT